MKTSYRAAALLGILACFLVSCKTSNFQPSMRKCAIACSKDTDKGCFVKFNDGTVKVYSTLALITGVFTSPHLLADGKIKLLPSQLTAYQNAQHFAISQKTFASGHKTIAAVETLPGFAVRVLKGDINVYVKKYFNGHRAVDEYYVQQGEEGKVFLYDDVTMKGLLTSNAAVALILTGQKSQGAKEQAAANRNNEVVSLR